MNEVSLNKKDYANMLQVIKNLQDQVPKLFEEASKSNFSPTLAIWRLSPGMEKTQVTTI